MGVPLSLPVIFGVSSQSLVFNFSQKDYIRAARAGLNAAQLQLKETRGQIAEDVAVTYLNLDTAQRRRDAMLQEEGFATRLVTIVQERLDAGQDTKMESAEVTQDSGRRFGWRSCRWRTILRSCPTTWRG